MIEFSSPDILILQNKSIIIKMFYIILCLPGSRSNTGPRIWFHNITEFWTESLQKCKPMEACYHANNGHCSSHA